MSAGNGTPGRPPFALIKLPDEVEKTVGAGMDLGGKLGDLKFQTIHVGGVVAPAGQKGGDSVHEDHP